MKRITLTSEGSARVDTDDSDPMPSDSKLTPYRLWKLPDGSLAYVRRVFDSRGGTAQPVYKVHDADGTRTLFPNEWRAEKARARQTDALAEVGPKGGQAIRLALKGRITYTRAVQWIEERRTGEAAHA